MATQQVWSAAGKPLGATGQPRLIFSTDLCGEALLSLLQEPGVLDSLAEQAYGVALNVVELDDLCAQAVRCLNERRISVVAVLNLPPEDGFAFNLRNYPEAHICYQSFHSWATEYQLRFEAVGLSIEPPLEDVENAQMRWPRALLRRLWLARENLLYEPGRTAYLELITTIHHDGFEVHTFQLPVIADDRRAGTTLVQRALDIVDLPSDVDVLMCSSSVPFDTFGDDLGGALIASYGEATDAIAIGSTNEVPPASAEDEGHERTELSWNALRRDLLLADVFTDTIYVYSLEDCVERGFLPRIAGLEWGAPARPAWRQRVLIRVVRGLLFVVLVMGRFGLQALAWTGWVLALIMWLRGRRARRAHTAAVLDENTRDEYSD